jgi:uncharacterized membrane protein
VLDARRDSSGGAPAEVIAASASDARRPAGRPVPGWVIAASAILVLIGLTDAVYLTITHFTTTVHLACSGSGTIDCEKVTTSPQSHILGIPVAVLGLVFFVVYAGLCTPAAWRSPEPLVRYARLAWAIGGVVTVVYLIYAELFEIDAICLWCSLVHVVTIALFIVVVVGEALIEGAPSSAPAG